MNGTRSCPAISFRWPATSICSCSDSTTQGPAIRNRGCSRPASKPQSFIGTAGPERGTRGSCGYLFAARRLVLQRGMDERLEERMAAPRRRLELGVELHADEPRVHALRQLDDLGQALALGQCRDHEAGIGEALEVVDVRLVAVPMPFGQHVA